MALKESCQLIMGGISTDQAYRDFADMSMGKVITFDRRTVVQFHLNTVELEVKYMLSSGSVGTLSWGKKLVKISPTEYVSLLALKRKKDLKMIHVEYLTYCNLQECNSISRGSFYEILRKLTKAGERILTAVDYVTGVLINDQVALLQRIGDDFAETIETKKKLTDYLELVRNFLKKQYDNHVLIFRDDNGTHGIEYGLEKDRHRFALRTTSCKACNFVNYYFQVLCNVVSRERQDYIGNVMEECRADALLVLDSIEEELELYRGHRVCVCNQKLYISQLNQKMEETCLCKKGSKEALVVMNWKMKFEATSARETTQKHFGTRGIGWHVFLVMQYKYNELSSTEGSGYNEGVVGEAVRHNVYCDKILEGSNNQDGLAVLSMLEAFLRKLKEELNFIESVKLQSDNVGYYQRKELVLAIPVINAIGSIYVAQVVHTEKQDGKGLIDAHFARETSHLYTFMTTSRRNRVRAIDTAMGLAEALAWSVGIQNSFVQLVSFDTNKLSVFCNQVGRIVTEAKLYFSRSNDIIYIKPERLWINASGLHKMETFAKNAVAHELKVYGSSNIGEGVIFSVIFKDGTFKPLVGESSNAEANVTVEDFY